MSLWKKLTYLVPSIRRAADRDMHEELEALEEIAGRRALGNLTLAAEDARSEIGWCGWSVSSRISGTGCVRWRVTKLFTVARRGVTRVGHRREYSDL